jgi:hypothetical protein
MYKIEVKSVDTPAIGSEQEHAEGNAAKPV